MTTTHTHSPWIVDGVGVKDSDGYSVCSTGNNRAVIGDERAANLRLIAAAPDLLDALRRVLRHIPDDAGGASLSDDVHRARAAIAKATVWPSS